MKVLFALAVLTAFAPRGLPGQQPDWGMWPDSSSLAQRLEARRGGVFVAHYPPGPVYLHPLGFGLRDALVHVTAVVNHGEHVLKVISVTARAMTASGASTATVRVAGEELERRARAVGRLAKGPAYDFFRRLYGLDAMLGPDGRPTTGPTIEPGTGLAIQHLYLSVPANSAALRIEAVALAGRDTVRVTRDVPLVTYENANGFSFPIAGTSYITNASQPAGSHRWRSAEEFALDVSARDLSGRPCREPCTDHAHFYAFGTPVLAAAPGTVARTQNHVPRSPVRRAGESTDEFRARFTEFIERLRTEDPDQLPGNYVILDHGSGEYTYYGHLDHGSVAVAAGDSVVRGQPIGRLGHSGFTTAPHLHFQLMNGSDQLFSRGLPIVFDDLIDGSGEVIRRPLRTGEFVTKIIDRPDS